VWAAATSTWVRTGSKVGLVHCPYEYRSRIGAGQKIHPDVCQLLFFRGPRDRHTPYGANYPAPIVGCVGKSSPGRFVAIRPMISFVRPPFLLDKRDGKEHPARETGSSCCRRLLFPFYARPTGRFSDSPPTREVLSFHCGIRIADFGMVPWLTSLEFNLQSQI